MNAVRREKRSISRAHSRITNCDINNEYSYTNTPFSLIACDVIFCYRFAETNFTHKASSLRRDMRSRKSTFWGVRKERSFRSMRDYVDLKLFSAAAKLLAYNRLFVFIYITTATYIINVSYSWDAVCCCCWVIVGRGNIPSLPLHETSHFLFSKLIFCFLGSLRRWFIAYFWAEDSLFISHSTAVLFLLTSDTTRPRGCRHIGIKLLTELLSCHNFGRTRLIEKVFSLAMSVVIKCGTNSRRFININGFFFRSFARFFSFHVINHKKEVTTSS